MAHIVLLIPLKFYSIHSFCFNIEVETNKIHTLQQQNKTKHKQQQR